MNDEDFTTVMIVAISVMLVLGIFLVLCLVRFPSYDTIENLLRDKRSFRHEWDNQGAQGMESKRSAFLPNPVATPRLLQETKSGHVKSIRLPKHDQQPDSHLPPMMSDPDEDEDLEPRKPEPLPYSSSDDQQRPKSVKFQDNEELILAISNLD